VLKHTVVGFPLLISPSCTWLELTLVFSFLCSPVLPVPHEDQYFSLSFVLVVAVGGFALWCARTQALTGSVRVCVGGSAVPGSGVVSWAWGLLSDLPSRCSSANLAASPCQNEEKRNLSLGGHVGFDSLPDQLVSKSVTQGFSFNILCVGEHGPRHADVGCAGGTVGLGLCFLCVLLRHGPRQ